MKTYKEVAVEAIHRLESFIENEYYGTHLLQEEMGSIQDLKDAVKNLGLLVDRPTKNSSSHSPANGSDLALAAEIKRQADVLSQSLLADEHLAKEWGQIHEVMQSLYSISDRIHGQESLPKCPFDEGELARLYTKLDQLAEEHLVANEFDQAKCVRYAMRVVKFALDLSTGPRTSPSNLQTGTKDE